MAPISNDLLLAAALTSTVPAALAQPAPNAGVPRTGVATTVKAGAARSSTTMYIDGTTNQRLTTDANSTMHVLFSDQSALTLGPDSEMTIAKYEFNPQAKQGQILLDLTKGLLRVVGGLISKNTATVVRTSTATIGIRGGISVVDRQPAQTSSIFMFGQDMSVSTPDGGNTQTVTRQGFGITGGPNGLSSPQAVPTTQLSQLLGRMEAPSGSTGGTGGNTRPPGAPPGQLLSTQNIPGGSNDPASSLSSDRLSSTSDNRVNVNNSAASGNVNDALRNALATRPTNQS